ncbi:MAG TPA: adenosine kinase, partial [Bacteroidales bacterium]|nr:adenosine kinase [Bacteroidales bacterium]
SMQLVNGETSRMIRKDCAGIPSELAAGGSAANTIHGLASLGVRTAFIGKVGDDEMGRFFAEDFKKAGCDPKLLIGKTDTGVATTFITPDSERTFATYLGSAAELTPDDLSEEMFKGYEVFHIEGYLVQNHALIRRAVELAKSSGCTVSLDLASYNVVEANLDFLTSLIGHGIDIVFANEEEIKAFTGHEPELGLEKLSGMAGVAVVKVGSKGAMVKRGVEKVHVPAYQATVIDTTGAGDLFASGFLYGFVHGLSLAKSAEYGALLASTVISTMGARIAEPEWNRLKEVIGR